MVVKPISAAKAAGLGKSDNLRWHLSHAMRRQKLAPVFFLLFSTLQLAPFRIKVPPLCLGSEAQPVLPTKPFPIFLRLSADVNQSSEKADELTRLIALTSLSDLVHVGGKPPKALPVVLTLPMLLLTMRSLIAVMGCLFPFHGGCRFIFPLQS